MPKYPLIISNQNYIKLLQICAKKGCSMGRLLNDIVNDYVKNYDSLDDKPKCAECNLEPVYEVFTKEGQRVYYCELHFKKGELRAYKKIGN